VPRKYGSYASLPHHYLMDLLGHCEPCAFSKAALKGMMQGMKKMEAKAELLRLLTFISDIPGEQAILANLRNMGDQRTLFIQANEALGRRARDMVLPVIWQVDGVYQAQERDKQYWLVAVRGEREAKLDLGNQVVPGLEAIEIVSNWSSNSACLTVQGTAVRIVCLLYIERHGQKKGEPRQVASTGTGGCKREGPSSSQTGWHQPPLKKSRDNEDLGMVVEQQERDDREEHQSDQKGDDKRDDKADNKGDDKGDFLRHDQGDEKKDANKKDDESEQKGDDKADFKADNKGDMQGDGKGDDKDDDQGDVKGDDQGDKKKGAKKMDGKREQNGDDKADDKCDGKGEAKGDAKGDVEGDEKKGAKKMDDERDDKADDDKGMGGQEEGDDDDEGDESEAKGKDSQDGGYDEALVEPPEEDA
jgi:hypothetical protein